MILSRKWLNEFVDVSDISDREFDEAMTLSGSKVETVTALDEIPEKRGGGQNFVHGKAP